MSESQKQQFSVLKRVLTRSAILTGLVSASERKAVSRMPTFDAGKNSTDILATDVVNGVQRSFTYARRSDGTKHIIRGMKSYFNDHGLRVGDEIEISKVIVVTKVKVFQAVFAERVEYYYSIRCFRKN